MEIRWPFLILTNCRLSGNDRYIPRAEAFIRPRCSKYWLHTYSMALISTVSQCWLCEVMFLSCFNALMKGEGRAVLLWPRRGSNSSVSRSCSSRFLCDSSTTVAATLPKWWRWRRRYRPTTVRAPSSTPPPLTASVEYHRRRRHYCFRFRSAAGRRHATYAADDCRDRTAATNRAAGALPAAASGSRRTRDFRSSKPEVTWHTCRQRRRDPVGELRHRSDRPWRRLRWTIFVTWLWRHHSVGRRLPLHATTLVTVESPASRPPSDQTELYDPVT